MSVCADARLVDRHFAARTDARAERRLRAHLESCDGCRARYERHALLERIDPGAPGRIERLAGVLGLRRRRVSSGPVILGILAVAGLALVVASQRPDPDAGFVARGAAASASTAAVQIYRVVAGGGVERVERTMRRTDELAFSYTNPRERPRLLVFGVDEHRHVYWYHPSWISVATTPRAIAIEAGSGAYELPEAVRHELDGARLALHAIFLEQDLSVADVERLVAGLADEAARLPLEGADEQVVVIDVVD